MTWPIDWPADRKPTDTDTRHLAEQYASNVLRMLTLFRVGGDPITVIPVSHHCQHPRWQSSLTQVYPSAAALRDCLCHGGCSCPTGSAVELEAPVGRIDEVLVDGVPVPAEAYRVENSNMLVRTDGGKWPSCNSRMAVTYLNAYPVDIIGAHVGGLLADEFLKALEGGRDCRLPEGVKSITRAGMSIEFTEEMFAGGQTGIVEVDTYLMQWNPYGLRTRPQVYSPDRKRQRQITWGR